MVKNGNSEEEGWGGGAYVKFPPWWGYGYFLELHIRITLHLPFLGITDPMQLFRLLVYTAAEVGAQQFIEMIFNSSAGRIVFEAYKGSSQLPEVIARDHGNEETAQYLECITKRYNFGMAKTCNARLEIGIHVYSCFIKDIKTKVTKANMHYK